MKRVITHFTRCIDDFNKRPLTEADLLRSCQSLGVSICWAAMPVLKGFHTTIDGRATIFLDRELAGAELLFVAFHELAHAVLHESDGSVSLNFFKRSESRKEQEADAIALICLVPKCALIKTAGKLRDLSPFERELLQARACLYQTFGV